MAIHAQLATGDILEFPDGTPDDVVDKAVRSHMGGPDAIPGNVPPATTAKAAPKPPNFVAGVPGAISTGALATGGSLAGGTTAAIRQLAARFFGADPEQARLEGQEAGGEVASFITPEPSHAAGRVLQSVSDIIDKSKLAGFNPLTADAATAGRAFGNAASAAGTAAKYAGTDVAGDVAKALQFTREQKAAAAAPKVAVLNAAKEADLTRLPTQTNPILLNSVLEGYGGKVKTAQEISQANATKIPKLAQEQLGSETPLVPSAINTESGKLEGPLLDIRQKAVREGYDPVRKIGAFANDQALEDALDALSSRETTVAQGFPNATVAKDEVTPMVAGLKQPMYDSHATIDLIQALREKAANESNASLANAYRGAAKAFEDRIGRHLDEIGQPELLKNFQDARTKIAQTYDVAPALSPGGDVSAAALAARGKKVPLTGNLKTISDFAREQEKAVQSPSKIGSVTHFSPLDTGLGLLGLAAGGGGALLEHPAAGGITAAALAAAIGARPLARKLIASKGYQDIFVSPRDYKQPGFVEKLASAIAGRKETVPPEVAPQGSQIPAVPYEKTNIAQMVADQLRTGDRAPVGNEIDPSDFPRELALAKGGSVNDAMLERALRAEELKKRYPPASVLNNIPTSVLKGGE